MRRRDLLEDGEAKSCPFCLNDYIKVEEHRQVIENKVYLSLSLYCADETCACVLPQNKLSRITKTTEEKIFFLMLDQLLKKWNTRP